MILDVGNMESIMTFSKFMASGRTTIPDHLKGNPADCAAVITQAMMWRMNPYAVAQKTHLVNGTLGYEGQLVNAAITSSGVTQDRLNYEWFGDWTKLIGKFDIRKAKPDPAKPHKDPGEYRVPAWTLKDEEGLGIRVWATIKGESEPRVLELLLAQARVRNSPLWVDDPRQQMAYLGAKRWARLHTPDVILGVYTPDELQEFAPASEMKDINAPIAKNAKPAEIAARKKEQAAPSASLLKSARDAADKGKDAFAAWWKTAAPSDRGLLRAEVSDLAERCETADRKAKEKTVEVTDVDDFVADMDKANNYTPE